jgi:hypothetical protein
MADVCAPVETHTDYVHRLLVLELAVLQKTGTFLYRLKDSCYFVGTHDQHEAYEAQVTDFAKALKLHVSFEKDQAIGCLQLSPQTSSIEESKVSAYAHSVKNQLSACFTMFDWIRVWNKTAGTYASHLFGPLADVFGKAHLNAVRIAYKLIFEIVLDGKSLTAHVTNLLATHTKRPLTSLSFALEAFIYLPVEYGGLGVKNPFVTMTLARDLCDTPDDLVTEYLASEEAYYNRAAEAYAALPPDAHSRKIEAIYHNDNERVCASLGANRYLNHFMTKEELFVHRERSNYPILHVQQCPSSYTDVAGPSLTKLYSDLLNEPYDDVPDGGKVRDEVQRLSGKGDMRSWNKLSGEDKWVLQLYGEECFEKYGGLEMWVGELVPQEVLKAVRGACWNESDDDSDSSVSDMTEP